MAAEDSAYKAAQERKLADNRNARKRSRTNMLNKRANGAIKAEALQKRSDLSLRECGDLAFLKRQMRSQVGAQS